eukprot:1158176-Pyramimonas_sp.AAC.1
MVRMSFSKPMSSMRSASSSTSTAVRSSVTTFVPSNRSSMLLSPGGNATHEQTRQSMCVDVKGYCVDVKGYCVD